MPILVEADTTTAGVLVTALPAGSQVVARADDVDGLLNGARRLRRRARPHRGHADRRRPSPSGSARRTPPRPSS